MAPGVRLADLTWKEAEAVLTSDRVVVLPIGAAAKEHGLHLRLNNDQVLAEAITDRLLKQLPIVVAPTLTTHYYPAFVEYPGSISLSQETATALTVEVCTSLARFGPRRFYALNTGVSTIGPLEAAATQLAQHGILLQFTRLDQALGPIEARLCKQERGSHADESETSMMLALASDRVAMAHAVKEIPPYQGRLTRDPNGPGTYSPSGVWGDPTLATAEKGHQLVDALVNALVEEVQRLIETPLPQLP
jgi:creatinine amidohydrolase